jgi:hypothetical protein
MEEGKKIIEDIKDEVKNSIDETASKNELVEGTLQEIADYKKEVAPPDDEYLDADNPDDQTKSGNEESFDDGEGSGDGETGGEAGGENDTTANGADENGAEMDAGEGNLGDDTLETPEAGGDDLGVNELDETSSNTDEPPELDTDNSVVPRQVKQGNVVININASGESHFTSKDLKRAKEGLLLHTAKSFASAFIPVSGGALSDAELPDKYIMASEGVNALGDIKKEVEIRLAGTKYAIIKGTESQEEKDILSEKLNKLTDISTEAVFLSGAWAASLHKLGLTQNGLLNSNESTLFVSRNIISRFLTGTKTINPFPAPYTSRENILANAFDIIQLRQTLKAEENPNSEAVKDLVSRENLFYHNVVSMDDKETKEKATAVIDLNDMVFKKALTANFITDYKIKSWEQNVGKDQKDTNAEVTSRVEKKFENLWQRPLNSDEKAIVVATTNNEDVTEIIPTPYEKFLIKLSKESMFDKGVENNKPIASLTPEENGNNRFKAKLFTTILKSLESFNLVDKYDIMEVDKFCNSTNINLLHI